MISEKIIEIIEKLNKRLQSFVGNLMNSSRFKCI